MRRKKFMSIFCLPYGGKVVIRLYPFVFLTFIMEIDLHLHSNLSDSKHSYSEIINFILKSNIKVFSITDHNYIKEDLDRVKKIADKNNVNFVEGIEISTKYHDGDLALHILGYSNKFDKRRLNKNLKKTIEGYNTRAKKIIKSLNSSDDKLNFSFEKLFSEINSKYLSRNHIADKVSEKLNLSFDKALRLSYVYLKENWMIEPANAIKLINKSGGIAVLAHPLKTLKSLKDEKKITVLFSRQRSKGS